MLCPFMLKSKSERTPLTIVNPFPVVDILVVFQFEQSWKHFPAGWTNFGHRTFVWICPPHPWRIVSQSAVMVERSPALETLATVLTIKLAFPMNSFHMNFKISGWEQDFPANVAHCFCWNKTTSKIKVYMGILRGFRNAGCHLLGFFDPLDFRPSGLRWMFRICSYM